MADKIRDQFLGWQCRIRQMSVRDHEGKPLPGMRPRVTLEDGTSLADGITLLLLHEEPAESRDLFRHIVKITHDPRLRREAAIKMLSSAHYQYPDAFSDCMTASFSGNSKIASSLLKHGCCHLEFNQFGQCYTLPCRVSRLERDTPAWETTFWHNHMFNPTMPSDLQIFAFAPDWRNATTHSSGT
ncbi:MAG: hypothetical protein O7I42_14140 [Alphaproteobacteria bacterium]|nr:hypothetical protein [Alphaproteobacteria bacterium]